MSSSRNSPTDTAQITIFLDLVEQYDYVTSSLSPGEALAVEEPSSTRGQDFRHALIKAFLLRKFIATKDNLYLPKTTAALERLSPGCVEPNFGAKLLARVNSDTGFKIIHNNQTKEPQDTVFDLLYGAHLHGDYGRWYDNRTKMQLANELQIWTWVTRMEEIIHTIRDLTLTLVDAGKLVLGDPPVPLVR